MPFLTMASINTALAQFVSQATLLEEVQDYDALTEGIINYPCAQVYWAEDDVDTTTENQQTTFGAGVMQYNTVFNVDIYVCPRAHSLQLYPTMYPIKDQLDQLIAAENVQPFFGLDGIKSFQVSTRKGIFTYANQEYFGLQYQITLRLF